MEEDIWKIFIQITKGLHDLHEYDILHRDLKSANVFLFKDGSAKLGDLNVSKITSRGLGCTQTGTPYYASPEVWRDNPYNLKSDIWSLGCVFYELIMLKTPFRAETMKDLYKKVMKGEYPPIPKTFCPKFQIVIDRILKVKSEERPNTTEILNMPEIVDKIAELNIFKQPNNLNLKKNPNSFFFKTSNNINQIMKFNRNMSDSSFELNCNNFNDNNNYNNIIDEFLITRLKYTNDNDNDYFDKKTYINKSCELNTNINNRKGINYHLPNKKCEEIYKIYQKNIDYFQRKYKQKKKIVLNTIKYPNKLSNLNSKLPEIKYDNDYAINAISSNKNKKIHKIYLSPNGFLPQIKKSKKNSKKVNEEIKNDINKDNNTNSRKLDDNLNFHKRYLMNTLQMKINQNHPFNYKGKIDIIIEE
jgi:NIMA (never in mitosis gene a)-related kinase